MISPQIDTLMTQMLSPGIKFYENMLQISFGVITVVGLFMTGFSIYQYINYNTIKNDFKRIKDDFEKLRKGYKEEIIKITNEIDKRSAVASEFQDLIKSRISSFCISTHYQDNDRISKIIEIFKENHNHFNDYMLDYSVDFLNNLLENIKHYFDKQLITDKNIDDIKSIISLTNNDDIKRLCFDIINKYTVLDHISKSEQNEEAPE